MKTPQIIWVTLLIANLVITFREHGKPRTGRYNFNVTLLSSIIAFSIVYSGGFFNNN